MASFAASFRVPIKIFWQNIENILTQKNQTRY